MAVSCYSLCHPNHNCALFEQPDSVQLWIEGTQAKDKKTHHELSSSIPDYHLFLSLAITGFQYDGTIRVYFVRGYTILQFLQCGNATCFSACSDSEISWLC